MSTSTATEVPEHPLLQCIVQVRGNGTVAVVAARGCTPGEIQHLFSQIANSEWDLAAVGHDPDEYPPTP